MMSHAIIWPLPGDGEETEVRLFSTDEEAVTWAGEHCPTGGWQYARVVGLDDPEPPTAEDYAEAGLPGLARMPVRPSSLIERLAEAVVSPALGAQANEVRTDQAVEAVAAWLRERDNEHGDNRLAELADRVERGEA